MAEVMLKAVSEIDHARSKTISMFLGMTGNGSLTSMLKSLSAGIKPSNTWYGSLVQMAYSLSSAILVAMGVFQAEPLVL